MNDQKQQTHLYEKSYVDAITSSQFVNQSAIAPIPLALQANTSTNRVISCSLKANRSPHNPNTSSLNAITKSDEANRSSEQGTHRAGTDLHGPGQQTLTRSKQSGRANRQTLR